MTEQSTHTPPGPAAESARRSPLPYVAVAMLSLAAGAGLTWFALRSGGAGAGADPAATGAPAGHAVVEAPPGPPPSGDAIYIAPARQQLIGVRTAEVSHRALESTIRTVGTLGYDETRVAEVHTKVAGWLESVFVDFVGKTVRKGQPLFSVYSPDLVATQKEYLLALRARAELGGSRFAETRAGAASLVAAARERLRLWDVTDAQIEELERTGEPRRTVTVHSPFDGTVLDRQAFPGRYLTPEVTAFRIADLSTIWVRAQVFEYELPFVRVGQEASVEFPYGQSARPLTGRISFIHPEVDPMTRRVTVRIELRNPGLDLKPETFVTVLIRTGGGRSLAVPSEAVIDDGDRQYVILASGDGYFEPRAVTVGRAVDGFHPVAAGLAAGDVVVTSAQFLIDSETNLQAAMRAMAGGGAPAPAGAAAPAAGAGVEIGYRSRPDPPRTGENELEVTVTGADGRPVADAVVEVIFFMPAMPSMGMPAMRAAATLEHAGGGVYRGTGQVLMAGRWDVTVAVSRDGQRLGTRQLAVVAR